MTDVNGMTQGFDSPVQTSSTPAPSAPAPVQQGERAFTQSEVDDIVKKAKYGAVESFKRQINEQPDYVAQKHPDMHQPMQHQAQSQQQLSSDEARRIAQEEAQNFWATQQQALQTRTQEQEAQRIASEFFNKLQSGKEKYSDFDSVVGNIQYGNFPNVVQLAQGYIDNTTDVMYELGKDRTKLAAIENLARMSPQDAVVQIQRLSQSIKDNEKASQMRHPNVPLSQIRSSQLGVESGGSQEHSVSYYRTKYKV